MSSCSAGRGGRRASSGSRRAAGSCCAAPRGSTTTRSRPSSGVNAKTVGKWRNAFRRGRLDGLADEPRPGVPRSILDDKVEEIVRRTIEETPPEATHWSTRSLARRVGVSRGDGRPDLAGVRVEAAPGRDVQDLDRPAVRREGQRRGRALSRPARASARALRRREEPDPGARPLPAGAADPARDTGQDEPRLQAQRHHQPVRRARSRQRQGDRRLCTPATARSSSRSSSTNSTRRCRPSSTCT